MIINEYELFMNDFDLDLLDILDEYADIEDIQLEAKNDYNLKSIKSITTVFYAHLLKYVYLKEVQTKSWVNTILDSNAALCNVSKSILNKIENELDSLYENGRNDAIEETKKSNSIYLKRFINEAPLNRISEWDLNFLLDRDRIVDFLNYHYTDNKYYHYNYEEFIKNKLSKIK